MLSKQKNPNRMENPSEQETLREEEEVTCDRPLKKRKKEHQTLPDEELKRRGIVYISRMPPNMKPRHLKALLGEWGVITRVYCAPESMTYLFVITSGEEEWMKRKKRGGNRRRQFKEAWVEFESKRKAYNAALALNGQRIGERKKVKLDVFVLTHSRTNGMTMFGA